MAWHESFEFMFVKIFTLQAFRYFFFNKHWISDELKLWKLSHISSLKQKAQRKDSTSHTKSKLALSWLSKLLDVSLSSLEYVRTGVEAEWQACWCHSMSCYREAWGDVISGQCTDELLPQADSLSPCYRKSQLWPTCLLLFFSLDTP